MDSEEKHPMDRTIFDAFNEALEMAKKYQDGIQGVVICFKYEPHIVCEECDPKAYTYYSGGGLTNLDAMGTLEYAKAAIAHELFRDQ